MKCFNQWKKPINLKQNQKLNLFKKANKEKKNLKTTKILKKIYLKVRIKKTIKKIK